MKRRRLTKPTHRLVAEDGTLLAEYRCGRGGEPAIKLATGEVERSASFILDCDLLMGRWQSPLLYMFGPSVADAIQARNPSVVKI